MASAYSPEQISTYLKHIKLPQKYHAENQASYPHNLAFLAALHVHTISTIPYENLSIHYSSNRKISLDPQHLFQKIVGGGRGRGGYCMENSILFNHILRGLGFEVYTAGVRVRLRENGVPSGTYIGWVHIVNIVTLPCGAKYMLDVGFGGDGAINPVPLIPGHVVPNIGQQDVRLIRDHIPQQVDKSEKTKLWIYQYRNGNNKAWNSFYAFPEVEFLEEDFKVMNWYTGNSPMSFQTYTILIVKFLRRLKDDSGEEEVYGKRMLVNGTVKENLGGSTKVVEECQTENERVQALRKWFGITLTEEEKRSIVGHCTELKVPILNGMPKGNGGT
ncbi:arylamine N-acetyltransferase 4 [Lindgomyces ingoldianus]|uniref:Arylamine N-acetyltransferase 4 n=1 Tax=Lindgomyces ingoldianus TaxID=673940 RepID=A0ACB6R9E6_9PLEO|nr:arylamine N-acetyltransferase 4 [Lindgomyces ingoldianus]KAF2474950.1 arylamine N-acetyltransferase 4 [Lindgomyces ingoldianus]